MKIQKTFDDYYDSNSIDVTLQRVFSLLGYNIETISLLTNWVKGCGKTFYLGDYHMLIMETDNTTFAEEKYNDFLSSIFSRHLIRYSYLLSAVDIEVNNASLKGLNGERVTKYGKSTSKSGTDIVDTTITKSEDYTENGNNETEKNANGMEENAPISATLGNITTPNYKNKSNSYDTFQYDKNNNFTADNKNVEESTYNSSNTESGSDSSTDPYMYEVFMRIVRENNIYDKIILCYKSIIAEFNTAL